LFFPSDGTQNVVPVPQPPTNLPEVEGLIRAIEAAVRPAALTNVWTGLHCAMLLMVTLNVYKLSSLEHGNLITYPAKIRSVSITTSLRYLEILLSNARQVRPELSKKK
jgi:hypothetical protein